MGKQEERLREGKINLIRDQNIRAVLHPFDRPRLTTWSCFYLDFNEGLISESLISIVMKDKSGPRVFGFCFVCVVGADYLTIWPLRLTVHLPAVCVTIIQEGP